MKTLTFQLHLLQPMLVAQSGSGEENSTTAQDFIPASAIRGAVIKQFLQTESGQDISHSELGRRLFFDGSVIYLNGYIGNSENIRMLPKPLSWRIQKDDESLKEFKVWDFSLNPKLEIENPKMPSGSYAWIGVDKVNIKSPDRYIHVHNGSDERIVKKAGKSFVFRYDALAKGQVFFASILSNDEELLNLIQKLLKKKILVLGGSRSAEYGQVSIEALELHGTWQEAPEQKKLKGDLVSITLLSDAIIQGSDGQFHWDLTPIVNAKHQSAFMRLRRIGGFNRKWGLPLPQALAIQAGSVFVYDSKQVNLENLNKLQNSGIGERRIEGFGRFAINWNNSESLNAFSRNHQAEQNNKQEEAPVIVIKDDESRKLLKRMVERRLRLILDNKLALTVTSLAIVGDIKNSQLSRVRLAVLEAGSQGEFKPITEHLNQLKASKSQFERTRVEGKSLLKWLEDGLNENCIWEKYLKPDDKDIPQIADIRAEATKSIQVEYVTRLLDSLFRKTSRANQKGD